MTETHIRDDFWNLIDRHALQVLRQARLSRNKTAAIMVGDLVYEMASTGLRTPEN